MSLLTSTPQLGTPSWAFAAAPPSGSGIGLGSYTGFASPVSQQNVLVDSLRPLPHEDAVTMVPMTYSASESALGSVGTPVGNAAASSQHETGKIILRATLAINAAVLAAIICALGVEVHRPLARQAREIDNTKANIDYRTEQFWNSFSSGKRNDVIDHAALGLSPIELGVSHGSNMLNPEELEKRRKIINKSCNEAYLRDFALVVHPSKKGRILVVDRRPPVPRDLVGDARTGAPLLQNAESLGPIAFEFDEERLVGGRKELLRAVESKRARYALAAARAYIHPGPAGSDQESSAETAFKDHHKKRSYAKVHEALIAADDGWKQVLGKTPDLESLPKYHNSNHLFDWMLGYPMALNNDTQSWKRKWSDIKHRAHRNLHSFKEYHDVETMAKGIRSSFYSLPFQLGIGALVAGIALMGLAYETRSSQQQNQN